MLTTFIKILIWVICWATGCGASYPLTELTPPAAMAELEVPHTHETFLPRVARYSPAVEQWLPLVAGYFEPEDVDTAMCLIRWESEGDPSIKNRQGSSAAGLFQFLRSTWDSIPLSVTGGTYDSGQVFQAEANVRSAAWLQNEEGWTQWSPYNRGLCR